MTDSTLCEEGLLPVGPVNYTAALYAYENAKEYKKQGLGCNSVIEYLPSRHEVLDLVLSGI